MPGGAFGLKSSTAPPAVMRTRVRRRESITADQVVSRHYNLWIWTSIGGVMARCRTRGFGGNLGSVSTDAGQKQEQQHHFGNLNGTKNPFGRIARDGAAVLDLQ